MFSSLVLLGLVGVPALVILLVLLIVFVFEIIMFVDAIRNQVINDNTRTLWIVGMLLIHPFVAIAYYFTDYKKQP